MAKKYRLVSGKHWIGAGTAAKPVEKGAVVELTDEQAANFGAKFELVAEPASTK